MNKKVLLFLLSCVIFSIAAQADSRYDAGMNLPFNEKAGDVNPQTGAISISESDISLPGRAGVNFSFGRSWNINQASVYDMSFDPLTGENVLAANSIAKQNRLGIGWSTSLPYILKDSSSGQLVMTMFVNGQAYELDQEGLRLQPSASRSNILGYDLVDKRVDASSSLAYSDFTGLTASQLAAYNATASGRSAYVLTLTDNSKYYFNESGLLMSYVDKTGLNSIWYFYNPQNQLVLVYDAIGREIQFTYDGNGNLGEISYDISIGTKDAEGNRSRVVERRSVRYEYEAITDSELPEVNKLSIRSPESPFRLVRVLYPEGVVKEYDYQTKPFVFSFNGQFHVTNYSALLTSIASNVDEAGNYSNKREFFYEPMKGRNYQKTLYNGFMEYFKISKQQVRNRHGNLMSSFEYRYYDEGEQQLYRKYAAEVQTGNVTKRYIYRLEGNPGKDHVLLETQTTTLDGFVERSATEYTDDRRILRKQVYRGNSDVHVYTERFNYNKKGQLLDSTDRLGLETETVYHDTFGMPVLELVYISSENQTIKTTHVIDEQYGYVLESYLHTPEQIIRVQKNVYGPQGNLKQQIDTNGNIVNFDYDQTYNAFPVKTYTTVKIREYASGDFASNWTEDPGENYTMVDARKFQIFNTDGTVWIEVDNDGYAIEHYYDSLGAEIETVIPDADDVRDASFRDDISDLEGSEDWDAFLTSRKGNPGTRILIDRTNAIVRQMSDIERVYTVGDELDTKNSIFQKAGQQGDGLGNVEAEIVYKGSAAFKRNYTAAEIAAGQIDKDWEYESHSESVYDNLGRMIAITDADTDFKTDPYISQDVHGVDVKKYAKTWIIQYDDLGRQLMVQYPDTGMGHTFKYFEYDDINNTVTIIDAENRKVTSTSDWAGNVIETIAHGDHYTREHEKQTYTNIYDEAGRLQLSIDPKGLETGYNYDERNLLIKQWYDSEYTADVMTYDERGLLITKTDRKGQVLKFHYDELGRATMVEHFTDSTQMAAKNPIRSVRSDFDRRGNTIRVQSNELIEYYEYDHGSRVTHLHRKVLVPSLADVINPVWQGTDDMIFSFQYNYSEGGLVKQMIYPDGSVHQYDYDTQFARLDAIQEGIDAESLQPFAFGLDYNKAGVVTEMQWANGTTQNWSFDNRKRIKQLRITQGSTVLENLQYTLNGNGDITKINANEYKYDGFNRIIGAKTELPENKEANLNQLVEDHFGAIEGNDRIPYNVKADIFPSVDNPDGRINGGDAMQAYQMMKDIDPDLLFDVESFAYDRNGNRTELVQNGNVFSYEYGERNRLTAIYVQKKDAIQKELFAEYFYDENGNTTQRILYRDTETETIDFTFDTLNRLTRTDKSIVADDPENNHSSYDEYYYDNAGNRFVKRSNTGETTLYLRHGQIAVAMDIEIPKSSETEYLGKINRYVLSGDLLAGRVTTTVTEASNAGTEPAELTKSYYHLDHLNSTKMMTSEADDNGVVLIEANYIYRAFGEQLKQELNKGDAGYTYGGKELDDSTNLYYFNARFYDATIGRFINVDPIQDGTNWYIYCSNNPLNMVDPTGLEVLRMTSNQSMLVNIAKAFIKGAAAAAGAKLIIEGGTAIIENLNRQGPGMNRNPSQIPDIDLLKNEQKWNGPATDKRPLDQQPLTRGGGNMGPMKLPEPDGWGDPDKIATDIVKGGGSGIAIGTGLGVFYDIYIKPLCESNKQNTEEDQDEYDPLVPLDEQKALQSQISNDTNDVSLQEKSVNYSRSRRIPE